MSTLEETAYKVVYHDYARTFAELLDAPCPICGGKIPWDEDGNGGWIGDCCEVDYVARASGWTLYRVTDTPATGE